MTATYSLIFANKDIQNLPIARISRFLTSMTQNSYIQSMHVGEVLALALGFGLSTLAVFARIYTKVRLTQTFKQEDCKFAGLKSFRAEYS